jgi:hypothetical protein
MEVVMAENDKPVLGDAAAPSQTTFSNLRGRQSVRATFKLSDSCIEAIGIVAAQLGIKQKSLFDHLFSDTQTLIAIAAKFRNARIETANRIQKTFVISRGALVSLEEIARSYNAPRDALIEISVQRLLPMIAEQRQRHAKRKAVFARIRKHLEEGRKLLSETYAELGEEELITDRLNAAMAMYESAFKHMSAFIEKSEGIETFEPAAFTKVDIVFEEE